MISSLMRWIWSRSWASVGRDHLTGRKKRSLLLMKVLERRLDRLKAQVVKERKILGRLKMK